MPKEKENCKHKWELRHWMRGYEAVYCWVCEKCGEAMEYLEQRAN